MCCVIDVAVVFLIRFLRKTYEYISLTRIQIYKIRRSCSTYYETDHALVSCVGFAYFIRVTRYSLL